MSSRLMAAAVLTVVGSFIGCANMPTAPGPAPSSIATVPPAAPLPQPVQDAPTSARYTVVFDSTWSATSHPVDFPASAHYSGLIGATHAASVSFWTEGGLASEGIRRMAERGSKQPLDDEVNRAIGRGDAQYLLSGPDLRTSPGSTNLVFEISQAFPLVTLVTMVAPSPDWFVGVSGLPLFQDGRWIDEVRVDLFGFDAGTDSGITYTAPDHETTPRQPIARLTYPLTSSGPAKPLGTLTFTRTE